MSNVVYYSIMFASLRRFTQERVSIGIFLLDNDITLCKFSHQKLSALKRLFSKDEFNLINDTVSGIEEALQEKGEIVSANFQQLYKISDPDFSLGYLSYLSRYRNNLITYTEPKAIDISLNEENAIKLFETYVGILDQPEPNIIKETPIHILRTRYSDEIADHFIKGHTISNKEVPNLLVPVKVDLVGQNGIDVFVQSIDMTAQQSHIINEISTFFLLKETYKKNNVECQDFVLTNEPPKQLVKQYELWKQLKDSNAFNHVDISEGYKIIEYAEKFNVKPTFGEIG